MRYDSIVFDHDRKTVNFENSDSGESVSQALKKGGSNMDSWRYFENEMAKGRIPSWLEVKAYRGGAMQHKTFDVEVKEFNEQDLTVTHFISTERRDRGGYVLYSGPNSKGKGMVMEGWPAVLHSHGYGPMGQEPIAKCIGIGPGEFRQNKGIVAKTKFFPDETGKRLFAKTTQGYAPSWSIGWRPMDGKTEVKHDSEGETRHVYEWELLEYSLVGVPMQPDAQTLTDKGQGNLMFKMMADQDKPKKFVVEIPDGFIQRIIRETVQEEIGRLKGRVE